MGSDPDPSPRSKGELKRLQILAAAQQICASGKNHATLQEIKSISGIRSFNTLTRQLMVLHQEGLIEWDRIDSTIKLINQVESLSDS